MGETSILVHLKLLFIIWNNIYIYIDSLPNLICTYVIVYKNNLFKDLPYKLF